MDPRIHFALVCGAKSCPPIKASTRRHPSIWTERFYLERVSLQVFNPRNLEAGLKAAAEAFTDSEVEVDEGRGRVTLSKIFGWYRFDFGKASTPRPGLCGARVARPGNRALQDQTEQLRAVAGYMRDGNPARAALERLLQSGRRIEVAYKPYDWSSNTK